MEKRSAKEVFAMLSKEKDAMIVVSTREESAACSQFLLEADLVWCTGAPYTKNVWKGTPLAYSYNRGKKWGDLPSGGFIREAEDMKKQGAFYLWSDIEDMLDPVDELWAPSEDDVMNFLLN